eukprot:1072734-Pyramimonas_sp.AAC.1
MQNLHDVLQLLGHGAAARDPRLGHPEAPVQRERVPRRDHRGQELYEGPGPLEGPVLHAHALQEGRQLRQRDGLRGRARLRQHAAAPARPGPLLRLPVRFVAELRVLGGDPALGVGQHREGHRVAADEPLRRGDQLQAHLLPKVVARW